MRKISVLFTPSLVLLTIQAPPAFPILIRNSAYPATAPQAQVSPDTQAVSTVQLSCDKKQGSIDSYFGAFWNVTYNCLNITSQTILIVNAYDSPTTQPCPAIFDKAFGTHSPPSSQVSCSAGCPTIKPKATRLDISFDSANKAGILVYSSTLNNPACPVVPRTSATTTQWAAMIALANQYHTGQGHTPPHIDSALQRLSERTFHIHGLAPVPLNTPYP